MIPVKGCAPNCAKIAIAASESRGGAAIRTFFYLVVVPLAIMVVLGLLRFRFAIRFWRWAYVAGLIYVALVLVRALFMVV